MNIRKTGVLITFFDTERLCRAKMPAMLPIQIQIQIQNTLLSQTEKLQHVMLRAIK